MRRCFFLLLPALFMGAIAHTQLVNNGATITVQAGATIKCTGTIQNGGTIQNAGIVSSDGELRNEVGGTLANNGTEGVYEATTKFVNYGNAFTAIKLRLIGNVNTDSIKTGTGSTYDSVILAKGIGNTGTLSDAMTVNGGVRFDNDNNQLIIEDENLIMGSSATFVSADANDFVVTNNIGTVTKQGLVGATVFKYEVGFGVGQYNPLTVTNSGTINNISARCLQNVLDQGLTGSPVTSDFANNSWVVASGGSGYNLQLTAEWALSDELSNFNRLKTGIARYVSGTDWDLLASNVVAASGSGPYNRTRNNITSAGVFAVADLTKVNSANLNLRVLLQGDNYNSGTHLMADLLRDDPGTGPTDPIIPTTQPYSAALNARFTRIGIYDGSAPVNETVNSTVFNTTGNDAIVDWVYISTLDPLTPSVKLQTRAALLQRDGDIVDLDGISPVSMPIDSNGNYHLLVSHRNHLSVRTPVVKVLNESSTFTYDFSSSQSQAYQNVSITTNTAMKDLGGGAFGLWGGNANSNNTIRYGGSGNDPGSILTYLSGSPTGIINNVYTPNDLNMDRRVRYGGSGNDPGALLTFLGGNPVAIFSEHL